MRLGFLALLVIVVLTSMPTTSFAHWSPDDWANRKHDLTVCVNPANCPAAFKDSVNAAMQIWNNAHLTWSFSWADSCSVADVEVRCFDFEKGGAEGLGLTSRKRTNGIVTKAITYINTNSSIPWGWCDDKYEIVSTIAHELGHSARLREAPCL